MKIIRACGSDLTFHQRRTQTSSEEVAAAAAVVVATTANENAIGQTKTTRSAHSNHAHSPSLAPYRLYSPSSQQCILSYAKAIYFFRFSFALGTFTRTQRPSLLLGPGMFASRT